jgi:hypothetical protein
MIKTEEIIVRGQKSKPAVCDIFSYSPTNIEELSLGNLYIVAELKTGEELSHLVSLLISLIKREYYFAPHRGPLASLENCLKKSNQALSELANQGNLDWLGNLNFACAALKDRDLFLAQTGNAQTWLWREGQLTNLAKKTVPSPKRPHPAKTFQSVVSGKTAIGDKLILATPALFDLFSTPGFKQLLDLPKIENISDQINRTLREEKRPPALGAFILEIAADADESAVTDKENKNKFTTPPIGLEEIIK